MEQTQDKKGSIIVVDDDPALLDMLEDALRKEGFVCEKYLDGESALERMRDTHFEIVITDIKMPGMSGFALTEAVRKIWPDTTVIIMTGFIEDFSFDNAIKVGAADFIKKPFTIQELFIRIKYVLLQAKLRTMAITDDLTGLLNRRGFFTHAEQYIRLATREKSRFFMITADLDGLKAINDTMGHKEGDVALIDTANILREVFRDSDIISRIGGDEFVVIPVKTTKDGMDIITRRLADALEKHHEKEDRGYTLSFSMGIACYDPESPSSIDELLAQADVLMYRQKMDR
jgi:diguanylate cyclase (GGDEF)-like protein